MLVGCAGQDPTSQVTQDIQASPDLVNTPTATVEMIPLVALVNGVGISQQEFEDEITRFETAQVASGIDLATSHSYEGEILNALIDQQLLIQGALVNSLDVEDASLDAKIVQIIADSGGETHYKQWLAENHFTPASFRQALYREMMAANMVAKIVSEVPDTVEHVHARHILVASQTEAEDILDRLQNGEDFGALARSLSLDLSTRLADGDLGWFPRGTLTMLEVEEAAFSLQPGETSKVVESSLGFHIVQSLEVDQRRPTTSARQKIWEEAVETWLDEALAQAEIEIITAP